MGEIIWTSHPFLYIAYFPILPVNLSLFNSSTVNRGVLDTLMYCINLPTWFSRQRVILCCSQIHSGHISHEPGLQSAQIHSRRGPVDWLCLAYTVCPGGGWKACGPESLSVSIPPPLHNSMFRPMLGPELWDCGDGGCGRNWFMWSPMLSLALALRLCLSFPSPHVPFLSSPLKSLSPEPLISVLRGDLHSLSYQNPQKGAASPLQTATLLFPHRHTALLLAWH